MYPQGPQNPYAPPAAPMQPPGGGPMGYGYEFNAEENAVISSAALWARILGVALIVTGLASLINCNVISFILDLIVGIFFITGGSSLAAVVNTQGNDIAHMMQALGKLGTAFKIRVIVTLVALVLILLFAFAVVVLAVLASAR
jgi:uncharacterized membrane protein HdeD (DUF308 family)